MALRDMFHHLKQHADRIEDYENTKATMAFEAHADPKVQLEQAIQAAQEQAKKIQDRCIQVVQQQKLAEMRFNTALSGQSKLEASTKAAAQQEATARAAGDDAGAAKYHQAALSFATKLAAQREQVEALHQLVLDTTAAADDARKLAQENQELLAEKQQEHAALLAKSEYADMKVAVNEAMDNLTQAAATSVPTLDEVRAKIDARYAEAAAHAEVGATNDTLLELDTHHAEIQSAAEAELARITGELNAPPAVPELPAAQ